MQNKIRTTDERIKSALKSSQKPAPPPMNLETGTKEVENSEDKKSKSVSFVTFDLEDDPNNKQQTKRTPHPSGRVNDDIPEITFESVEDVTEGKKKKNSR